MTGGRLMLITGDKAYNHEEELKGHRDPHIAVHGSFSMMVNYDAYDPLMPVSSAEAVAHLLVLPVTEFGCTLNNTAASPCILRGSMVLRGSLLLISHRCRVCWLFRFQ